jgi:hypothetical protein
MGADGRGRGRLGGREAGRFGGGGLAWGAGLTGQVQHLLVVTEGDIAGRPAVQEHWFVGKPGRPLGVKDQTKATIVV